MQHLRATTCVAFRKESRTKFANATNLDRKSGVAQRRARPACPGAPWERSRREPGVSLPVLTKIVKAVIFSKNVSLPPNNNCIDGVNA
jgi:hypothetical protein